MKKIKLAVFLGFILTVCFSSSLIKFSNSVEDIKSNVFRLHILANSDTPEDQQLKLLVRDEILKYSDVLFDDLSLEESIDAAQNSLDTIEQIARQVIYDNGYSYDVSCKIAPTQFSDRDYGDFTMPAGEYTALCVYIGEGEGQNWWCVMYPPLCVGTAQEKVEDYFCEEQTDILQNHEKYEIKFKCVEIFTDIKYKLKNLFF